MISSIFRRGLFVSLMVFGIAAPQAALADCTNPAGITGEIIYNSTVAMLQFCNGTNWINAAGSSTGGGPEVDPEVGTLTPSKWCQASAGGTEIVCTADPPAGSDNLGNHLATQDVDAGGFKLKEAGSLVLKTVMGGPGVSGSATLPGLADVQDALSPADGEVLTYNNTAGEWQATAPASGADNLGNHTATQNLVLGTNWLSGDGGNEGLTIDASGNVGIGTTVPFARLHVYDATAALVPLVQSSAAQQVGVRFKNANADFMLLAMAGSNSFGVWDTTNSQYRMFINSSGNVGIAEMNPADKLHVVGQVRVDNDTNTTNKGCIRYDGTGNRIQFSHDCTTFADMGTATETDPQVGTTTANNYCRANAGGTGIDCNVATVVTAESDPQVGTTTANKWCAANAGGTAIDCTQDAPTGGGGLNGGQMFTSTTSFTVPAGITTIKATMIGGGGGGGRQNFGAYSCGGGGGAHVLAWVTVTPGASMTVTVGGGGAGATSFTNGSPGTASSFGGITANPGGGGMGNGLCTANGGTASGGAVNVNGLDGIVGSTGGGKAMQWNSWFSHGNGGGGGNSGAAGQTGNGGFVFLEW